MQEIFSRCHWIPERQCVDAIWIDNFKSEKESSLQNFVFYSDPIHFKLISWTISVNSFSLQGSLHATKGAKQVLCMKKESKFLFNFGTL